MLSLAETGSAAGQGLAMVQRRLNLEAVRTGGPAVGLPPVSRRAVLGLAAGAAAAGSLPAAAGTVNLRRDGDAVLWRLDEVVVWRLDPAAFDGSPKLLLTDAADGRHVALRDARWPGTTLPADCELVLTPDGGLRWRSELGGLEAVGVAAEWLTGRRPLTTDCALASAAIPGRLELRGPAAAAMAPGALTFRGLAVAQMVGDGAALAADEVTLRLAEGPSLLEPAPERRSLLELRRGRQSWPFEPPLAGAAWALNRDGEPFDRAELEVAEGAVALLLVGDGGALELTVDGLRGEDGSRFGLRLGQPRYARIESGGRTERAVTAAIEPAPRWLESGGARLELRGVAERPFEACQVDDEPATLRCEPQLTAVHAPLAGVLVEAALPAGGEPLSISEEPADGHHVRLAKAPLLLGEAKALRPAPPRLPQEPVALPALVQPPLIVTRPDDLMQLTFQFHNLLLQTAPQPRLVRQRPGDPAYIVVGFPAQHIGEETFPEPPASAPQKAPPVGSRQAGASRLAFLIPPEVESVPYTLSGLLNWSAWTPSLASVALPPDEPLHYRPDLAPNVAGGAATGPLAPGPDRSPVPPDFDLRGGVTAEERGRLDAGELTRRGQRRPVGRLGRVPAGGVVFQPANPGALRPNPNVRVRATIVEPSATTTALELPYRLLVSPNAAAGWAHRLEPVTVGGRTELWHTRLGVRTADGQVSEAPHWSRAIRCIWSPDYQPGANLSTTWPAPPFDMPMLPKDRHQLVRLTSDFGIRDYKPPAVPVQRLMLTGLGGWLTCRGTFYPPAERAPELSLSEWKHEATMGRDQFVKLVYEGYLFPFGHRCIKTVISERKVVQRQGYASVAYLRKRMFLTVLEPVKAYPVPGMPFAGRGLPFRRLEILTRDTPNLDLPVPGAQRMIGLGESCFWPTVGGQDFQFLAVGEDHDGERVELNVPLIWVELGPAINDALMQQLVSAYESAAHDGRRERALDGQLVALAASKQPGDACAEAVSLTFGAAVPTGGVAGKQPRFYPRLQRAAVRHPGAKALLGDAPGARSSVLLSYFQPYLEQGFAPANQADVFCGLATGAAPLQLTLPPTRGGGVATPGWAMSGLSRTFGPLGGDPAQLAAASFDPAAFLGGGVKLLGGINLADVVAPSFGTAGTVPTLRYGFDYGNPGTPTEPTAITVGYSFKPKLQDWPAGAPLFDTLGGKATGELTATVQAPLAPGAKPSIAVSGRLEQFRLRLLAGVFEMAEVTFSVFAFDGGTGQPFDCRPKVSALTFVGPLKFVEKLLSKAGPLLKGTPGTKAPGGGAAGYAVQPILELDTKHVAVGASLALPALAMGAFSLQNVSALAKVNVPFGGEPVALIVRMSEREAPFLLQVTLFGGGGFFGLVLNTAGVEQLEASLEFGAVVALSLGVAAGSAKAVGGIYYKWQASKCELTGYLKLSGCLKVIGLVTVSCTFNLSLTYKPNGNQVWGQAKLTVEVEVGFFSKSVSLKVERQFAGEAASASLPNAARRYAALPGTKAAPPPSGLEAVMSRAQWDSYCAKFAV